MVEALRRTRADEPECYPTIGDSERERNVTIALAALVNRNIADNYMSGAPHSQELETAKDILVRQCGYTMQYQ